MSKTKTPAKKASPKATAKKPAAKKTARPEATKLSAIDAAAKVLGETKRAEEQSGDDRSDG